MTPDQARATYRRMLGRFELISVRQYTGAGTGRPKFDWEPLAARVLGADGKELVGPVTQTGVTLIIMAEDIEDLGFPLPLQNGSNWKVIVRGKELQIGAIDDNTRRLNGELIAYEIKAAGP